MAATRSTKTATFLVVALAMAACLLGGVRAEDHDVGGDRGWNVPQNTNFYSTWASGKTFRVGDVLEFEFPTGAHDVTIVNKAAYDSCTKTNPIRQITNGPAKVTLNTTGPQYFICTVATHCSLGQKLSVNVVGGGGSGSGNRTAPAPSGGSGSGNGTTPPTPGTGPGATSPPPPPNSAGNSATAGLFTVVVLLGVALFW